MFGVALLVLVLTRSAASSEALGLAEYGMWFVALVFGVVGTVLGHGRVRLASLFGLILIVAVLVIGIYGLRGTAIGMVH